MNPRVKGSDTFSHISWTIHSNIKILDILKSQRIELNISEKINLIKVPEVREKGVQTRRLYTPPIGTQRQFKILVLKPLMNTFQQRKYISPFIFNLSKLQFKNKLIKYI